MTTKNLSSISLLKFLKLYEKVECLNLNKLVLNVILLFCFIPFTLKIKNSVNDAALYVSTHLGVEFNHTTVEGLQIQQNEDPLTGRAKQKIERLNRTFKETYRITTGYRTIEGARKSFELWMFYYNFLRIKIKSTVNSLDFITSCTKINFNNILMLAKWQSILKAG